MIKALVTSGGTRAYIDEVRWLGNVSTGAFGAEIGAALLARGVDVTHLVAETARRPDQSKVDLTGDVAAQLSAIAREAERWRDWQTRYHPIPYRDFAEYANQLETLLKTEPFDIVILAAAVSDYLPIQQRGKISSKEEALELRLGQAPKLIRRVKDWAPDAYLVGFKLLVGASVHELIETARRSGVSNRADATVANDMRDLRSGRRLIHLVRDGEATETYSTESQPAEQLVDRVLAWRAEKGEA